MKAGYLMERLREVRSTPFDPQAVFDELSRVESMVSEEVCRLGPVRLVFGEDDETELLVGPPYDGMYLHYPVSYTHLRAHETPEHLVCRLLLEKNFFNDTATTEIYTY